MMPYRFSSSFVELTMNAEDIPRPRIVPAGNPCDHPDIIPVPSDDGDDVWRCTECGELCDYDEWMKGSGIKE
jgi:hypothetical protein